MEPLRPSIADGEFKTAAQPIENTVPLAFKENSPLQEELIEDLLVDENEN